MERLAQAQARCRGARYAEALTILDGCEDWTAPANEAATILRAHILARRTPVEALALLARAQDVFESEEGRFGYYVASMRAYTNTRNYEAAAAMGERARSLANNVDPEQRCLLWHRSAILRVCRQQYDPHDQDIAALLASRRPDGEFLGYLSRAYVHAGLGDYAAQAADLTAALEVATSHPGSCDPALVALQVHALLRLGLETGSASATAAAAEAYEAVPWSQDLLDLRFLCVRALAWDAFLRGDSAQAQWLLKDSKAFAPTDAWKVMAHLDRAYIARMNGNEHWAAEELYAANALAMRVEWSATHDEERQALVMFAVLYSPTDMAQAEQYVSTYLQLGRSNVDPALSLALDRRAVGFEKYALGRVQQVLGNDGVAIEAFQNAYEIFDGAGYHFRAALAAMGLFESTREATWLERARRHAGVFPRSALYASLSHESAASEDARLRNLTPMQRQIAFALYEGLELAQLSERFSRSAFTLEKHVEAVYARLGVRNRSALRSLLQNWSFA